MKASPIKLIVMVGSNRHFQYAIQRLGEAGKLAWRKRDRAMDIDGYLRLNVHRVETLRGLYNFQVEFLPLHWHLPDINEIRDCIRRAHAFNAADWDKERANVVK